MSQMHNKRFRGRPVTATRGGDRSSSVAAVRPGDASGPSASRAYKIVRDADLVMGHARDATAVERFRRLKTILTQPGLQPLQVIAVSSPVPRDGKTFVAANLALAFAEDRDYRTLLVDGDLRRPSISRYLQPEPLDGMHEVLTGRKSIERAICRPADSRLHFLPAGAATQDSIQLLTSTKCESLFNALRSQYEKIIVDTPPVALFADADVVGACTDGLVLVVRSGATPRPLYTRAIESITSTRVVGTVINAAADVLADPASRYNYYEKYYGRENGGSGSRGDGGAAE